MATTVSTATAAAVGIDIGSHSARVATFDENLGHPVCAHNSDGHRTTRVLTVDQGPVSVESLEQFMQERLVPLASDAAHTKDLHIVASIPNDANNRSRIEQWEKVLRTCCSGGVITEAAAVSLAYNLEESAEPNQSFLIVDGGAIGVKATIIKLIAGGMWSVQSTQTLRTVNGSSLVEPLAQSVAQQFEDKHRFPRGEVWQSKKTRAKLLRACEAGLTTLQINNTLTIHVDGLYEGMDCQVTIGKAKWDHLSRNLVKETREFLEFLRTDDQNIQNVLLGGNMHVWIKPIVESVFPGKLLSSSIEPAEAIALGCTKHAKMSLEYQLRHNRPPPTLSISSSPVSIAVNRSDVVIESGAPLPALATFESTSSALEIWQTFPNEKMLASIENLSHNHTTIRLLLSVTGKLSVAVGEESFVI